MAEAKPTCPRSAVVDILSYECSLSDVACNYLLVAWSTPLSASAIEAYLARDDATRAEAAGAGDAREIARAQRPESDETRRNLKARGAVLAVNVYLWSFQIGLCLAVGCVGISVVWSAHAGIIAALVPLHEVAGDAVKKATKKTQKRGLLGPKEVKGFALACAAAWTYYAVVEPPITTVAHAAAVLMGAGIGAALKVVKLYM